MTFQQQLQIRTAGHGDMHDLTLQVTKIVAESEITTGTVNVCNIGSTASIGTIEFEPGLQHDLPAILDKLIPPSATTDTSVHGTTATDIHTCRRHCLGRR
jgi:thiamine phosphate synthase YjbQ (UPF0047 family)